MAENDKTSNGSTNIIDEIEQQLEDILKQKKESVAKELEEKIKREQEEAQKKMAAIEQELAKEKEALVSYQTFLNDFESSKADIKKEIKAHLDIAMEIQREIEEKTVLTLAELKTVSELSLKLEDLSKDTQDKATVMKDDLQQKFGITAKVPELAEDEDVRSHLDSELDRLNKIKELLDAGESIEIKTEVEKHEPGFEKETQPETPPEPPVEGPVEETPAEAAAEEMQPEEESKPTADESTIIPLGAMGKPEGKLPMETVGKPTETKPEVGISADGTDQGLLDALEPYRKSEGVEGEGEISYFENKDKKTLDAEYIIAALSNSVDEAKKLYVKLSQTESPKEQFFVKQEIIRHQEAVRKLMLSCIRMCEKDTEFLPKFTDDIMNTDAFKRVLEKVSMENWSNQEDFTSFDEYTKELKDGFYKKITPHAEYLKSIISELKIEVG
jgi:hypothetical protein